MKYKPEDYLNVNVFFGDEGELSCHTMKIVKARKSHQCMMSGSVISPGSFARHDKALVDGDFWGSYYTSLEALERMIDDNELLHLPDVKPYTKFEEYNGE